MTSAALAPEANTMAARRRVMAPAAYGIVAISIAVIAIMAAPPDITCTNLSGKFVMVKPPASRPPPHYADIDIRTNLFPMTSILCLRFRG